MNKPPQASTNRRLVNPISEGRLSRSLTDQRIKKAVPFADKLRLPAPPPRIRDSEDEKETFFQFGTKRKEEGAAKLDPLNGVKGSNALDLNKDGRDGSVATSQWAHEERRGVVQAEMDRMSKLPANSSYVTHRMRVLNKILHLISVQRTSSQTEELELLFAGLSL